MIGRFIDKKRKKHLSSSPLEQFRTVGFNLVDKNQYSGFYRNFHCDVGYDAKLISGQYYWIRIFIDYGSSSKKELHKIIDRLEKNTDKETSQWTFTSVNLFFPFFLKRPKFDKLKSRLDSMISTLHKADLKTFTMEEANDKVMNMGD